MTLDWLEFLMVGVALSLDVFGAIACESARLARINKPRMMLIALLVAGWQTGALFVGRYFGVLLKSLDIRPNADRAERLIPAAVFILLGIRMLWKAKKEAQIEEVRQEKVAYLKIIKVLGGITLYTLLTGFGIGFLESRLTIVLPIIAGLSVVMTVVGFVVGYLYGAALKTKAYLIGGLLLLAVSADIVVRYIIGA